MDTQRAKEIAASRKMANVMYNGQSIYIENVNNAKGTALIHPLDDPSDKIEVAVIQLDEMS